MTEFIACYVQTLAPVHLGCDEVYEPMSFILQEDQRQMIVYDPWSFFQEMPPADRQKFTAICQQGKISSILQIYQFLRGRSARGRAVEVCPGLVKHYRQTLALPLADERRIQKELNNFTIDRTAFLADDGRPYIPGSAVKGALRTAYLNYLAQTPRTFSPRGRGRELEKDLLEGGSFHTDPFRLLKVSDFMPVGEVKTKIVYAVNEKKKISQFQAQGPYQILEVILPGAIFQGNISLAPPPRGAGIKKPLTKEALLHSAATFYETEKQREGEDFFELGLNHIDAPAPPALLLRLGRHSGAESVTIAKYRKIKIMQGRGQPNKTLDHATTFWLAAEAAKPEDKRHLRPFGWVAWQEMSSEVAEVFHDKEKNRQESQATTQRPAITTASPLAPAAAPETKAAAVTQVWEGASLTFDPGRQEVTAAWQGKKALFREKNLVPEGLHKKLFQQKKAVQATVTVESLGNYHKVIAIE